MNSASTGIRRKPGPANPRRGIEKTVSDLGRYFTGGTFGPGDLLPGIAELSKRFSLSTYAVREALKELQARGVIATVNGRGSTLTEAKPKHTLTRDGDDPSRHLHPTGPAIERWQSASIVAAELFDIHDRAPLHIKQQTCEHRTTGAPVYAVRTIPADVIADIEPEPDPYGDRTALIKAFTQHCGLLTAAERCRVILNPPDEIQTALGLEPATPVLEQRRLTRDPTGRLLMIESEITNATTAEWEYPLL